MVYYVQYTIMDSVVWKVFSILPNLIVVYGYIMGSGCGTTLL